MREMIEPTVDGQGEERHPAWAMIGASRVSSTPGAVLFDSDVRHGHYVVVRLARAARRRDLNRDWLHADSKQIIEVAMSEAQWASFVSSMNVGSGVPCTLQWHEAEGRVPDMPYAPRLQESLDEVRNAADTAIREVAAAFSEVQEAFDAGAGKKVLREKIRHLKFAIGGMPSNVTFAAESLSKHAENVVQKARVDIESMVVAKAQQLGLEPADLGLDAAQLGTGLRPEDDVREFGPSGEDRTGLREGCSRCGESTNGQPGYPACTDPECPV